MGQLGTRRAGRQTASICEKSGGVIMKWEYKTIKLDTETFAGRFKPEKLSKELNSIGEEGWELVNYSTPFYLLKGPIIAIFKRPFIAKT